MRGSYFNFSNFVDVTLYVFATLYALNIKIKIDLPNCDNDLVS